MCAGMCMCHHKCLQERTEWVAFGRKKVIVYLGWRIGWNFFTIIKFLKLTVARDSNCVPFSLVLSPVHQAKDINKEFQEVVSLELSQNLKENLQIQ